MSKRNSIFESSGISFPPKAGNIILELLEFMRGKRIPSWFGKSPDYMNEEEKKEHEQYCQDLREFHKRYKKMKKYHKEGYWKDWYWNKGGRDKVQASRKERSEKQKNAPVFKHVKFE